MRKILTSQVAKGINEHYLVTERSFTIACSARALHLKRMNEEFMCLFIVFRVLEEINLHFQESRRPHGKARGGRIAGYLTDEQHSQAGWIGALKCEVIFERALSCR